MVGHGVSRSDSEMEQKSCVSGAPTRAAQLLSAEAPGMISTSMPSPTMRCSWPASSVSMVMAGGVQPACSSTSKVGPAMP